MSAHPDGLVYQHSAWLRCLEAEYGRPTIALCCENAAGELTGLLPLVATRGLPLLRRSATLGARVASLPRTPVAGPLARDTASAAALLDAAVGHVRDGRAARLQIKRGSADLDGVHPQVTGAPWRRAYVRPLPHDPEQVRFGNSRNHSRVKWAVNKAAKEGVAVRTADDPADVAAWYRLYLETMREVAVPPRPLRLFEAMWRELVPAGLMTLYLAEHRHGSERVLIGGSVVLGLGRTAFYAFNGRLRSALALRPNDVIQWTAIRDAAGRGFECYDLGEVVEGDSGLSDFKRKWGSEEVRLHRYYHPPADSHETGGGPGRAARAVARVWPRTPLALTRAAGDLAYRWL